MLNEIFFIYFIWFLAHTQPSWWRWKYGKSLLNELSVENSEPSLHWHKLCGEKKVLCDMMENDDVDWEGASADKRSEAEERGWETLYILKWETMMISIIQFKWINLEDNHQSFSVSSFRELNPACRRSEGGKRVEKTVLKRRQIDSHSLHPVRMEWMEKERESGKSGKFSASHTFIWTYKNMLCHFMDGSARVLRRMKNWKLFVFIELLLLLLNTRTLHHSPHIQQPAFLYTYWQGCE